MMKNGWWRGGKHERRIKFFQNTLAKAQNLNVVLDIIKGEKLSLNDGENEKFLLDCQQETISVFFCDVAFI